MRFKTTVFKFQWEVIEGTSFKLRSSTLEMKKKALSWYMPDRVASWSTRTLSGNPTKSGLVNDFVKFLKKMEVRRVALPSQAKKALNMQQFRAAIRVLEINKEKFQFFYWYSTMMKFKYSLIACCIKYYYLWGT